MKSAVVLLLILLASATIAGAQNTTSAQPVTIDGSAHPELIPDAAAVRAILGTHANFKDAASIANAEKLHAKIGFSVADHAVYDAALQVHFNTKKQNPAAVVYANLLRTLSPDGQAKLKAFIQGEKAHMQYHTQPAFPQEVSQ